MSETHTLQSYLPRTVTDEVRTNALAGQRPLAREREATVLFADISGFTDLTRLLAERGPEGAEQLSRHLNACLEGLLQAIRRWDGDVVKFAGDALMAVWPHEVCGSRAEAVYRAAAAAQAGQRYVRALRDSGEHPFELRVGVSDGSLQCKLLGGDGRWETFIGGPAVLAAVRAESCAESDAVVLDRATWSALDGLAHGRSVDTDHVSLELLSEREPPPPRDGPVEQVAQETLEGFLSDVIRVHFQQRSSAWLGEMRRVHVGFVHLPELVGGTPLERAQELVVSVRSVLHRFQGALDKLSVDDKGAALLYAFGLPGHAHEDDAVRAVRAATEIRCRLLALGSRCSIGVTAGWVFCGTVGNDWRREYTVLGPAVNLAARLSQQADGAILSDRATASRLPDSIRSEAAGSARIKGMDEPVELVRVLGMRDQAPLQPQPHAASMVDRVTERARIQDFLGATGREQPPHILLLVGEAGIGKSRLVTELLRRAGEDGFRRLFGAGEAIDRGRLYHAWRPILFSLLDLDRVDVDPAVRVTSWLEQRLPTHTRYAPLLLDALGYDAPASEHIAKMSAEARAHNTRSCITALIRTALGKDRAVVVLEDAGGMDSASWSTARDVARTLPNVLVVVSTRPLEPDSPGARVLDSMDEVVRIEVGPIPPDDVLELVALQLGVRRVPGALARLVQDRSQGNPLFAEELANALVEVGVLSVVDGSCHLSSHWVELDEGELPATVNGILQARLNHLPPDQLQTLKVAAVIGKRFSGRMVADLTPRPEGEGAVHERLHALVDAGILEPSAGPDGGGYRFRHGLLRDAVYQTLLPRQRKALHKAAAVWYEQQHRSQMDAHLGIVAHHWRKGGEVDAAIHYLDQAGRRAARSFANDEAVHLLSRALDLAPRASRQPERSTLADWHHHLGEAQMGLGNLEAARAHYLAALQQLRLAPPRTRLGLLLQTVGLALNAELIRRRTPRLRLAQANDRDRLQAARIYGRLAQLGVHDNDRLTALNGGLRSMRLAQGMASDQYARSLAWGAAAAGTLGSRTLSRSFGLRAIEVLESLEEPGTAVEVHFILGTVSLAFARWQEAIDHLSTGMRLAGEQGDQRRVAECRTVAIFALHSAGYLDEVADHLVQLQHTTWQSNDAHYHLVSSLGQAQLALSLDDPRAARGHIEAARSLLDSAKVMNATRATVHAVRAQALLASSPRQTVAECWELSAQGLLASRPVNPTVIWGYDALGTVGLALARDQESFRPRFRTYLERLHQFARSFPIALPLAHLIQGQVEAGDAKPQQALRCFQRGLDIAREQGAPLYEARLLEQLARCQPDRAEELNRRAHEIRRGLRGP